MTHFDPKLLLHVGRTWLKEYGWLEAMKHAFIEPVVVHHDPGETHRVVLVSFDQYQELIQIAGLDRPTPRKMTGFLATLTDEQKDAALSHEGPDDHGPLSGMHRDDRREVERFILYLKGRREDIDAAEAYLHEEPA